MKKMGKKEDYIARLSEYIKRNLRKGYTLESLKWALVNQGHSRMEVVKAIERVETELSQEAPVLQTKPEITYEVVPEAEKKPWYKRIFGL